MIRSGVALNVASIGCGRRRQRKLKAKSYIRRKSRGIPEKGALGKPSQWLEFVELHIGVTSGSDLSNFLRCKGMAISITLQNMLGSLFWPQILALPECKSGNPRQRFPTKWGINALRAC